MTVYAITDTKKGEQGLRLLIFKLPRFYIITTVLKIVDRDLSSSFTAASRHFLPKIVLVYYNTIFGRKCLLAAVKELLNDLEHIYHSDSMYIKLHPYTYTIQQLYCTYTLRNIFRMKALQHYTSCI